VKIKPQMMELRRQLVSGTLPERSPQLAMGLGWTLNFLLGFVLGIVPVFGGCGPFGIALTAQAGAHLSGFFSALGASAAYLVAFPFNEGIKQVAAVFLVFTSVYIFQDLRIYKKLWFMPCMATLFTAVTGVLGSLEVSVGAGEIPWLFAECVLAGGGTYFFREALSTAERDTESAEIRHGVAVVILLSCLFMSLNRLVILDTVSIGRFAALLVVMVCAFKGGTLSGAAAGTALGLAMDLSAETGSGFGFVYAFAGLVSGLFSRHGRLPFVLSFIVSSAVAALGVMKSTGDMGVYYEVFAASVVFMLLPSGIKNFIGSFLRPQQLSAGESGLRKYAARRVEKMAAALKDLFYTVDSSLSADTNDEDISKIFDRAADAVCAHCKRKNECWNTNYMDTLSVFNDVTPAIKSRGLVLMSDIPAHFSDKCSRTSELVAAINGELRGQMYRKQFKLRLLENRSAAYSQYYDLSELLQDVSEELLNSYGPDVLSQRRLLRFLGGIDVEADVSVFRDKSGRLHIIIESARLRELLQEKNYLDRLSAAVGVRLCRPVSEDRPGEGRIVLLEAEPLSASVGIASMKKKGEAVSGDRGTYFKTDQGKLCIILSDGMGSGENAAKESVAVVRILERFLRAGVDPAVAMKMLNSMMLLKNGEDWGFATVDLMCIDLFTGETVFYKYGAAPSYVRTGRTVRRVRSENLAAGLIIGEEDGLPDIVKMRLKPGSLALVASDGVIAETNDAWLRELLGEFESGDAKHLARQALQAAYTRYGAGDDMTVLAVKIEKRG